MPEATMDPFEKRMESQKKLVKSKAKNSSSRLLKEVAKDKTPSPELEKKLGVLSELYHELINVIQKGEMKWEPAIEDFAKGAKDINKGGSKESSEE